MSEPSPGPASRGLDPYSTVAIVVPPPAPTLEQQIRRLVRRQQQPAAPARPTLNPLLPKAHPGCRLWLSPQEMRHYGIRHPKGFIGKREAIRQFRRQPPRPHPGGEPVDPSWMPAPRAT